MLVLALIKLKHYNNVHGYGWSNPRKHLFMFLPQYFHRLSQFCSGMYSKTQTTRKWRLIELVSLQSQNTVVLKFVVNEGDWCCEALLALVRVDWGWGGISLRGTSRIMEMIGQQRSPQDQSASNITSSPRWTHSLACVGIQLLFVELEISSSFHF